MPDIQGIEIAPTKTKLLELKNFKKIVLNFQAI